MNRFSRQETGYVRFTLVIACFLASAMLLQAEIPSGTFVNVQRVPGLDLVGHQHSPYVTADGLEIYFNSDNGIGVSLEARNVDIVRGESARNWALSSFADIKVVRVVELQSEEVVRPARLPQQAEGAR